MNKSLLIILVAFFFSGCVKTPNLNYNASMHKDIKSIAIVAPKETAELTVFYHNHPGASFGLIGGLAMAAEFNTKTSEYNKLIKSTKFNADAYFLSRLDFYLKKSKYKVIILPADNKRKLEYLAVYPDANVDAYLDLLVYNVGYIAGSPTAKYKPTITLNARLMKKSNKEIVYEKALAIGENFAIAKETDYLGYDNGNSHKDFDTLKEHAVKSVTGIKKALDKVAKHLALSLKRG